MIDFGDLLVLLGAGCLCTGLYLIDYRLALIGAGLLLLLLGITRLRRVELEQKRRNKK